MPTAASAAMEGYRVVTMEFAADDVTGVVLEDCGHYPAEEQPARFAEVLGDFLRG